MSEEAKLDFTGVGVMRDGFTVARNHFDLNVVADGIIGYCIWQKNNFRIPIISHIRDILKRRNVKTKSRENALKSDARNFFLPFAEIQGIVSDDDHKELQILSAVELITILFRPIQDYTDFVKAISEKVESKIFNRDTTEIVESINIS